MWHPPVGCAGVQISASASTIYCQGIVSGSCSVVQKARAWLRAWLAKIRWKSMWSGNAEPYEHYCVCACFISVTGMKYARQNEGKHLGKGREKGICLWPVMQCTLCCEGRWDCNLFMLPGIHTNRYLRVSVSRVFFLGIASLFNIRILI